ncbi:hypothetical protein B0H13DRAFT_2373946 [Mycena leptocephala]|nr:hypothetical protein B0H13DRAFT_2373946 [Mycena leptocephala]
MKGKAQAHHIQDQCQPPSNVVSFLQACALFGPLGRKPTLVLFTLVFSLGTALTTAASVP